MTFKIHFGSSFLEIVDPNCDNLALLWNDIKRKGYYYKESSAQHVIPFDKIDYIEEVVA